MSIFVLDNMQSLWKPQKKNHYISGLGLESAKSKY